LCHFSTPIMFNTVPFVGPEPSEPEPHRVTAPTKWCGSFRLRLRLRNTVVIDSYRFIHICRVNCSVLLYCIIVILRLGCLRSGALSRDFRPQFFFHQTIQFGPLIHGLKPFWIWLLFWRDIQLCSRLFSVDHKSDPHNLLYECCRYSVVQYAYVYDYDILIEISFKSRQSISNLGAHLSALSLTPLTAKNPIWKSNISANSIMYTKRL
jgi:hypothetical protein